jgi:hypothetical protein
MDRSNSLLAGSLPNFCPSADVDIRRITLTNAIVPSHFCLADEFSVVRELLLLCQRFLFRSATCRHEQPSGKFDC